MEPAGALSEGHRLLVVDDHPLLRMALVSLLSSQPLWRVEGLACSASARQRCTEFIRFDALLVTERLAQEEGLALLAELRMLQPLSAVVLLIESKDARCVQRARAEGLDGCLSKRQEPSALLADVERILAGERVFSVAPAGPEIHLTERQRQVLQGVCEGSSNKDIGRELGLSERTVKDHLAVVFTRLQVSKRAEAVSRAAALGWLRHRPE